MDVILSPAEVHFKIFSAFYVKVTFLRATASWKYAKTSFPCLWDYLQNVKARVLWHLYPTLPDANILCKSVYTDKCTVHANIHSHTCLSIYVYFLSQSLLVRIKAADLQEREYRGGMNAQVFNGIDIFPFRKYFPQSMMNFLLKICSCCLLCLL